MIKGIENNRYREGSIKKSQLTKRQASYKGPSLMKESIYDDEIDAELHDINMRIIKAKKEKNVDLLEELVEMKEELMLAKKERINAKTIRNTEPTTNPRTYSYINTWNVLSWDAITLEQLGVYASENYLEFYTSEDLIKIANILYFKVHQADLYPQMNYDMSVLEPENLKLIIKAMMLIISNIILSPDSLEVNDISVRMKEIVSHHYEIIEISKKYIKENIR